MRKIEFIQKRMVTERNGEVTLVYSLTVDDFTSDDLVGALENYGICVDIPEQGESACLRGITVSAALIDELIALISKNLVTPCTLSDVVYDWLCSK